MSVLSRKERRRKRHDRVRRKVSGTAERPRMAIAFSNRAADVQLIDDAVGMTLVSARIGGGGQNVNTEKARELGTLVGEGAKAKGITQFVVDRGGFKFHERVRAVVAGAQAVLGGGASNDEAVEAESKEEQ